MILTVVIAAYNESENVGPLTSRLITALDEMPKTDWRLIYVIEGEDGTLEKAQAFAATRPNITILYNTKPSGLGNAFKRGFAAIRDDSDFVVTMDADLNHQPEEIPRLVRECKRSDSDILIGSRKVTGSTVENAPMWKTSISNVVNRCMRLVLGTRIADQTSGFRVYRYSALRRLNFGTTGFAFLPEILLCAQRLGMKVREEPIRFVFRESGESKMSLSKTAISYVRLFLLYSVSAPTVAAIAILALGLSVRVALAFPPHNYQGDSDGVLAGLCADDVLQGHHRIFFPGGYRISSQSCYVTAAFFAAFGQSRSSLALTGILLATLLNIFSYLALRVIAGRHIANVVLILMALPPVWVLLITYAAYGYTEILMWCAASLWVTAVISLKDSSPRWYLLLGIFSGLALWSSIQSVVITIPLFLLLLVRRVFRSWRQMLATAIGLMIGAMPLLYFFGAGGRSLYLSSFSLQPVTTLAQFWANLGYTLAVNVPVLLAGQQLPEIRLASLATVRLLPAFALWITALIISVRALVGRGPRDRAAGCATLAVLVFAMSAILYSLSGAGNIRGYTWRYMLPVYLVLPMASAAVLIRLRGQSRTVAVAGLWLVALANVPAYPLRASSGPKDFAAGRKDLANDAMADDSLVRMMSAHGIRGVIGDYWVSYNLNFHSKGALFGIPLFAGNDYMGYESRIEDKHLKWAIVDANLEHLKRWQARLQMPGSIATFAPNLHALIPQNNPPPTSAAVFLASVRAADPPAEP